ncbi:MAG: transporter substrate-binding domain-containing protein [Clostridiales bacterium]|nr:transporter substrate-binding domain-containing protein [Clostridiales bacterium]
MKKIMAIAAAALMAVAMTGCGSSAPVTSDKADTAKDSDLAYLEEQGTVKVGYTIINPLNYTDDSGELVGFETEFATAVFDKLGLTPEFQEIDWDSKEVELNSKNIDCIWNGLTITPERQEAMSLTNPYLENRQVLVVRADDVDKYTASLEGANVIAEAGSAGEELATSDDAAFTGAAFTAVQSQATALVEVSSGTSDVAVIDYAMAGGSVGEGTSFENLAIIDLDFESEEYGVAFRTGSDVTEKVNTVMQELAADGTLQTIAEKYGLEDLLLVK